MDRDELIAEWVEQYGCDPRTAEDLYYEIGQAI